LTTARVEKLIVTQVPEKFLMDASCSSGSQKREIIIIIINMLSSVELLVIRVS
jgi:hypothetical protein